MLTIPEFTIYTYVKVWGWDYSQMCYAVLASFPGLPRLQFLIACSRGRPGNKADAVPSLCIRTVCSIYIWGTLAHLLTVKMEKHLASSLTLCTQRAYLRMYLCNASALRDRHIYVPADVVQSYKVNSEAKRAFVCLLSSNKCRPHLSSPRGEGRKGWS